MSLPFIKAGKKSSLIALFRRGEFTPRMWARAMESLVTKDELINFVSGGGVDHGLLIGLADDDHTQYVLADGTRNITGPFTFEDEVQVDGDLTVSGTGDFEDNVDVALDLTVEGTTTAVGGLETNTIVEQTLNSGVTIDSVLLKDNSVTALSSSTGNGTNDVDISAAGLLSFQGAADIAASVNTPVCLTTYTDVKERNAAYHLHGGLDSLDTGSALDSSPTDITVTTGTGKLMVAVNAGSDISGSITVTGTTVDRDTGAETPADTDTLTVDALSTDNSDTDASGNARYSFTGAYITSKWFKGSVTLSTSDLTLTDVDTYQVSFEQFNDTPTAEVQTFDITALATNGLAWFYAYLYVLEVTGGKCDITRLATLDLPSSEVTANKWYRLRRGSLATTISGSSDGIWIDMFLGPLASTYWENIDTKVWATLKSDVYGESS